ncbi:MAG: 2-C-methyl-D-erythritol 4-phosphate cytidylyltransferase [Gammaproteobacteria bacterium]|jgi:2-C-methyl-D-erythritol 4-phosphate cytidylyltransferase
MNDLPPVWAIIPAAGIGRRMKSEVPKQYLKFHGKTVLEHCLNRLLSHPDICGAVVVLNDKDKWWDNLKICSDKVVFTTLGDDERFLSVYNGLCLLQARQGSDGLALVHDAARPLVTHEDLTRVIKAAARHVAGAILATPVADTLKLENDASEIAGTVSRHRLWRALTPQVFHLQTLITALESAKNKKLEITDDASAIELMGFSPALVEGNAQNIKITNPDDLKLCELIWSNQLNQQHDK